jgi:hypothetical protein
MRIEVRCDGRVVAVEAPEGSRLRRCDPEEPCLVVPKDADGAASWFVPESVVATAARLGMFRLALTDEPPHSGR